METYKAKGEIRYFYSNANMVDIYRDYEPWQVSTGVNEYLICDLIDGKDFLEGVRCGGFIDYDGSMVDVFVDGYKSNLGLYCGGICQGGFILSEQEWEDLCNEHKVEVNWANR